MFGLKKGFSMKCISIILFVVGLLLECAAFFGDQAANIPFVMKIVAPAYVDAQAGMQTLAKEKTLEPDDQGFSNKMGSDLESGICLTSYNI
jgi:hypothetical protein